MVDWSIPITVEEMYGRWHLTDEAVDDVLDTSRDPRSSTLLYDIVGELGVHGGSHVLDIGCRDGAHGLELVRRYGCGITAVDPSPENLARARQVVHTDPAGDKVRPVAGRAEAIPAASGSFDIVWSRDVFSHLADLGIALRECRRVLGERGAIVVYQTFASPFLEPLERDRLCAGIAVEPDRLSVDGFEHDVAAAGLTVERVVQVGSQWREAWEEDGSGRTSRQLLHAARLTRCQQAMTEELGEQLYKLELANALWGVYQMIGKLEPRIYVLTRRAPGA